MIEMSWFFIIDIQATAISPVINSKKQRGAEATKGYFQSSNVCYCNALGWLNIE
jgi:hypothetical protein